MRRLIAKVVHQAKAQHEATSYQRSWDRARAEAVSPSHRVEIDAIFSTHAG